jgi:hypothetical protein
LGLRSKQHRGGQYYEEDNVSVGDEKSQGRVMTMTTMSRSDAITPSSSKEPIPSQEHSIGNHRPTLTTLIIR